MSPTPVKGPGSGVRVKQWLGREGHLKRLWQCQHLHGDKEESPVLRGSGGISVCANLWQRNSSEPRGHLGGEGWQCRRLGPPEIWWNLGSICTLFHGQGRQAMAQASV